MNAKEAVPQTGGHLVLTPQRSGQLPVGNDPGNINRIRPPKGRGAYVKFETRL